MDSNDLIKYEQILKDIKKIADRDLGGEAPEIDAEIIRSATRIFLYGKYHNET